MYAHVHVYKVCQCAQIKNITAKQQSIFISCQQLVSISESNVNTGVKKNIQNDERSTWVFATASSCVITHAHAQYRNFATNTACLSSPTANTFF